MIQGDAALLRDAMAVTQLDSLVACRREFVSSANQRNEPRETHFFKVPEINARSGPLRFFLRHATSNRLGVGGPRLAILRSDSQCRKVDVQCGPARTASAQRVGLSGGSRAVMSRPERKRAER